MFKRDEYVDFWWTFSFRCSARCFLASSRCRWRSVKSSLSGGMTNGFLLSSASPLESCTSVGAVEGAGIGGRGTCLVRLEREPGVPACRDIATVRRKQKLVGLHVSGYYRSQVSPDFFIKGREEGDWDTSVPEDMIGYHDNK